MSSYHADGCECPRAPYCWPPEDPNDLAPVGPERQRDWVAYCRELLYRKREGEQ